MPGGGCRGSRSCVCPAGGVQPYAERFRQNALGSFALAVAAYLLRRGAFLGMSLDVVIISAIMPLVPGVTFTAAIRDTLNGDYSSGVARMAEAVVVALAVASGVGLAIVAVRLAGGSV